MHNDRVNRRPLACAAILAGATLVLAGCGGNGSSAPAAGSAGSSGTSATRRTTPTPTAPSSSSSAPTVTVHAWPLTAQGRQRKVGQSARVSWHPNQKTTGVMKVSVTKLQKVPISAFKDWQLDAATQRSTPFYVHA